MCVHDQFSVSYNTIYTICDGIVAKFLHFKYLQSSIVNRQLVPFLQRQKGFYSLIFCLFLKEKGPDRNPGLLKIQYPMKNRYTNGVRGSQIVSDRKIFFYTLTLPSFPTENVMITRSKKCFHASFFC